NQIDKIDLLKIDAEKSELDIIQGIDDRDWAKIDQIVIEIHDRTGEAVKRIEALLIGRGYRCAVEEETLLEHSGLFNLYATRGDASSRPLTPSLSPSDGSDGEREKGRGDCLTEMGQACQTAGSLKRNLQDFCAALRSFMNQAAVPLVLCFCPRTPAAEADAELKTALNDAEDALLAETGTIANVHTISSAWLLQRYPVNNYY